MMSKVKRWLALVMLGLALALGGCGPAGEVQDGAEREQVRPGEEEEGLEEGGEGLEEGGEGD